MHRRRRQRFQWCWIPGWREAGGPRAPAYQRRRPRLPETGDGSFPGLIVRVAGRERRRDLESPPVLARQELVGFVVVQELLGLVVLLEAMEFEEYSRRCGLYSFSVEEMVCTIRDEVNLAHRSRKTFSDHSNALVL